MAHPDPSSIRNVAVIGHRGSGKTSLIEAMLYAAGAINRLGSVPDGTTVCDFDEDERRRSMTIATSLCHLTWRDTKVNLIDTPGEPSFQADALTALGAVDAALMVVNATAGVEVQTERLWQRAAQRGLPRAAVVTMLDRERADFAAAVAALRELSPGLVPIQIPIGSESSFRGVVNLVSMTATTYGGGATGASGPIPDDLVEAATTAREAMIDVVAENDDRLIEKYLEGEEITTDELIDAICAGVAAGNIVPVVCAAGALDGIGADRVLDLIVEGLPSPATAAPWEGTNPESGEEVAVGADSERPALAYCFKTLADQFSGRINLLRVVSGTLASDSHATGVRSGDKERIGQLFTLQGKEHVVLEELGPGDIGAVAKLKEVGTGDVLSAGAPVSFAPIDFPAPLMSFAVTAREGSDDDKLVSSLRRMAEEDPTLDVHRDEQTGDLIVGGLSQMHVEVIAERIERRFGVAMELAPPHVPYRETITRSAEAEGKHKKQSGGRGQYGDCWLRVEPLPRGSGFEFVDKVVGGAIPRPFIPAVEKGVIEAMQSGELAGHPVVDVRVTLYDGKHHAVDSSEMAFKIAGSLGMKAALASAGPVLLEPVMTVEVTVPSEHVGDVMGDLSSRRGHPLGMETRAGNEVIKAEVPMSEMLSYAPDLRAMTGGRGDYAMELSRYAEVPGHLAEKVAAAALA